MSLNQEFSTPLPEIQQGADLFFQAAIHYGYRYVFGNPGTTEAPFVNALARYPQLRYLLFLHENGATGAADGVARLTGWPAIVNLHLGPGLSNALANIHNARRAQVPMLVTVGQHHVRHLLEDSPLTSDIESLASVECKWAWTVKDAGELADVLYRATIVALTPPLGPVCLILPTNVLTAIPRTPEGRIPPIPSLQIPNMGPASRQDLEKAVVSLLEAKNPTLLVGGSIETEAHRHILELAKASHARIVRDLWPRRIDSPLLTESIGLPYLPEDRRDFFTQTDLLLLIGINSFTTHFFYENDPAPILAEGTQVIHLADNREALGKNLRGCFPLYGDISSTLAQWANLVAEREQQGQGKASLLANSMQTAKHAATRPESRTSGKDGLIDSSTLAQALRQCLPNKTILVDESVTASQTLLQYLLQEHSPVTTYMGMKGAALGGSVPVAVGAQLAAPDQQVVVATGDGSAMYSIQILWTAAHYHLPLLIVVCNNASYDIVKLELLRQQGTHSPLDASILDTFVNLGEPRLNFAQLASGMGISGQVVQKQADLIPALQSALRTCAQGAPALVDVHMSTIFPSQ